MVAVLVALAACETPSSESLRSVPTPPTVVFTPEVAADQEIVWTDLEEIFPERAAGLPAALSALRPGLDGASARAVLEAAHEPGVKIFTDVHGDIAALGSVLGGTTNVGVTLLLEEEGTKLAGVDVSIPDEIAVPMLTTRWGPPTETEFQDGGAPSYRWVVDGEPWTAELHTRAGDKAIVKFSPGRTQSPQ